jgi:heat shock protein HtpX
MALASALQKLQSSAKVQPMTVNPAVSHLFIVNPLGKVDFASLFASHPPTEKRIERLEQMARTGQV